MTHRVPSACALYESVGRYAVGPTIGATGLCVSAIILCMSTPTPSMTPSSTPQAMPDEMIICGPPRAAKQPPVRKPEMMAFQGSSFCLQRGEDSQGQPYSLRRAERSQSAPVALDGAVKCSVYHRKGTALALTVRADRLKSRVPTRTCLPRSRTAARWSER